MWNGIRDAFRGALNWIIRKWNGLEFSIPRVDLGPLENFPEGDFVIATFISEGGGTGVARRTAYVRNNGFVADVPSPDAPSTARTGSVYASSTAPTARHSAMLSGRRTSPLTRPVSRRCFAAMPMEPPRSPTPATVIFCQRGMEGSVKRKT